MCSLRLLACCGGGGRLCGRVCCGRGLCLLRQRAVAAAAVAEVGDSGCLAQDAMAYY